MKVYRVVKSLKRVKDLSGMGAFKNGGRWNSKGTYMLYTSINSSLAYLENLVHFDTDVPTNLHIAEIELADDSMIYQLPDDKYPRDWQSKDNLANKVLGDKWMLDKKFLGIKIRSAINPSEYNILLNPLFSGYHDKLIIISTQTIPVDSRLL
ncbi:MAG: RES family NAD+ phosphorylase [Mucilaginibacter sp.]